MSLAIDFFYFIKAFKKFYADKKNILFRNWKILIKYSL